MNMNTLSRFALASAILAQTTSAQTPIPSRFEAYENLTISGEDCSASAIAGSDTVLCSYVTSPIPASATVYSKITEGSCAANEAFTTSETTSSSGIAGVDTEEMSVTVSDDEKNCVGSSTQEMDFTVGEVTETKTVCEVTKYACSRSDVVDNDAGMSVNAAMLDATITYFYATDGTFEVSVATAAFDPKNVSAEATRTVGIQVWKGACGSTTCELTGASGATCYDSDPLEIGSSMVLCIVPEDSDVKVTGLQSVFVTPAAAGSETMTVVDASGATNFVTEETVNEAERGVTLTTLMIPLYYDEQLGEAGSVSIAGTALLEYISSTGTTGIPLTTGFPDRRLQQSAVIEEESPFLFEVPLAKKETPEIAQVDTMESGSSALGVGLAGLVAAGAYALF